MKVKISERVKRHYRAESQIVELVFDSELFGDYIEWSREFKSWCLCGCVSSSLAFKFRISETKLGNCTAHELKLVSPTEYVI